MSKTKIAELKPSKLTIGINRFIRFVFVSSALQIIVGLSVWLFVVGVRELLQYQGLAWDLYFYKWAFLTWIGMAIPLFAEMDAFGRYQNYKMVKDKLHLMGFDPRLVRPFMYSNCQRIAILVAANDLGCEDEVKKYFYQQGYRWYHIFPDTWIKKPLILFTKLFWEKILFTKYYQLKYFYW
ncbi:MAG: hypothetical protein BM563_10570 [Bacteroidetes bacterium MedPE-SWsnd-G1]|nr:MAG: hypothetical protein BM563_10570 [Bacteroidetes bacterium MedPE-SWsnd-G1]